VTVVKDRLYAGTHGGRVVCLDASRGEPVWEFKSGDSVLAAPAVDAGRVYFGSYDGNVYALDAATGTMAWKRDTGKPVVSTPAVAGDRVIVGSRSYDLFGLDARTGEVAWKRYLWFSWVESSPVVRDGVVYVGSSDAAALYAFDAGGGRPLWKTDVWGWAWGQPAVTARRVYMGTSALGGYLVTHHAGVTAVDRASGTPVWRFVAPTATDQAYGFTGSASVGAGRVFLAGLDGRVYAFAE
jgi:outer membrane protein assembly factor BamB